MDTIDKDLVFKYLDEMKKTDNLIILIGNDDYQLIEQPIKGNNKDFLKKRELDKKSDRYRLEYATQKLNKESIKFITTKDSKL